MSLQPKPRLMTMEEYLAWEARQEFKHELVDGVPMLRWPGQGAQAMAGASAAHNVICRNAIVALARRLPKGCSPFGSDAKILIEAVGRARYPDVTVQCGPFDPKQTHLPNPVAVIEVLSPSNTWFDQSDRLRDYQSVASIAHILFLSQERAEGELLSRDGEGWRATRLRGLEAQAAFTAFECALPFAELYDGLELG